MPVIWPVALLLLFGATFRRTAQEGDAAPAAAACEEGIDASMTPPPTAASVPQLERCLMLDPANPDLMTDLGRAYDAGGHPDLAGTIYGRALALDPHNSDLHLLLGELLLRNGDRHAARQEGAAALMWHPNGRAAHDLIARASMPPEGGR